jgi:hypothetical protein
MTARPTPTERQVRPNKFGARKTVCRQNHPHASKREATRCDELHLLLRAGAIESLEQQPRYPFVIDGKPLKHDNGRAAAYTADFRYVDRHSGQTIVEDSKGFSARDWPLRKALFRALFPDLVLREV